MKCTKANYTRVMKIENLSIRKWKLESIALDLCFHGSLWEAVMAEIKKLSEVGVKTPLQLRYEK